MWFCMVLSAIHSGEHLLWLCIIMESFPLLGRLLQYHGWTKSGRGTKSCTGGVCDLSQFNCQLVPGVDVVHAWVLMVALWVSSVMLTPDSQQALRIHSCFSPKVV